jgi:hypothetical protein
VAHDGPAGAGRIPRSSPALLAASLHFDIDPITDPTTLAGAADQQGARLFLGFRFNESSMRVTCTLA